MIQLLALGELAEQIQHDAQASFAFIVWDIADVDDPLGLGLTVTQVSLRWFLMPFVCGSGAAKAALILVTPAMQTRTEDPTRHLAQAAAFTRPRVARLHLWDADHAQTIFVDL